MVKYGLSFEFSECFGSALAGVMRYGSLVYRNGSDPH
jgi:hypothetical protein